MEETKRNRVEIWSCLGHAQARPPEHVNGTCSDHYYRVVPGMGSGELRRKYIILNLMLLINRGSELRGFFELVRNLEGCYRFGSGD